METVIICILIAVVICIGVYKAVQWTTAKEKTSEVDNQLQSLPSKYLILNNQYFSTSQGFIKIDHIILSEQGLLLIKEAELGGEIKGTEDEPIWSSIKKKQEKIINNPLIPLCVAAIEVQNILQKYKIKEICCRPILVYSKETTFLDLNTKIPVVKSEDLADTIETYTCNKPIEPEKIMDIFSFLSKENICDKKLLKTAKKRSRG